MNETQIYIENPSELCTCCTNITVLENYALGSLKYHKVINRFTTQKRKFSSCTWCIKLPFTLLLCGTSFIVVLYFSAKKLALGIFCTIFVEHLNLSPSSCSCTIVYCSIIEKISQVIIWVYRDLSIFYLS